MKTEGQRLHCDMRGGASSLYIYGREQQLKQRSNERPISHGAKRKGQTGGSGDIAATRQWV